MKMYFICIKREQVVVPYKWIWIITAQRSQSKGTYKAPEPQPSQVHRMLTNKIWTCGLWDRVCWSHTTLLVCIHPAAQWLYLQGGSDEDCISPTSAVHMDPGPWAQQELQPLHLPLGWYPPCVQRTPQVNVEKNVSTEMPYLFLQDSLGWRKAAQILFFSQALGSRPSLCLHPGHTMRKASRALCTLYTFLEVGSIRSP